MPTQAQLASAAWLHIGGASGAPRCLARREDVSPLWCLLLAGAAVVPAVTVPEPATEVPRQGLRVEVEQALRNWRQFCDFIAAHPQFHRVPALGIYLSAVAAFIEQAAADLGRPLAELWLQGDVDALAGPFDAHAPSRIEFWRWNADSRLQLVQDGDPLELHEITLVVDFEDLADWCRGFGLNSLDHPYFQALLREERFESVGTGFAEFCAALPADQAPAIPTDVGQVPNDGDAWLPETIAEPAQPSAEQYRQRYLQGDLQAALALAQQCDDEQQALHWARCACGLEDVAGQPVAAAWLWLAELALRGVGDLREARRWVELAAAAYPQLHEQGRLQLCIGRLWLDPAAGEPDARRAFQALQAVQRYCSHDDAEYAQSLYWLGLCWHRGQGCAVDHERAREAWRVASADGHGLATEALVQLLASEADAQADPQAAAELWEEALHHARQFLEVHGQQAPASLRRLLGEWLLSFAPVAWEEAHELLLQAAEAGDAQAMGLLSEAVYRDPASPLRNLRQALHWAWRYAVAQGLLVSAERGWRRWLFALVWYLRR